MMAWCDGRSTPIYRGSDMFDDKGWTMSTPEERPPMIKSGKLDGACVHGAAVCEPCAYDRGVADTRAEERSFRTSQIGGVLIDAAAAPEERGERGGAAELREAVFQKIRDARGEAVSALAYAYLLQNPERTVEDRVRSAERLIDSIWLAALSSGGGAPPLATLCPKCHGQKHVNTPPWVAGDSPSYTTASNET